MTNCESATVPRARSRRGLPWLALLSGCAAASGDAASGMRVAAGAGQVYAQGTVARPDSNPVAPPQDLEDDWGAAGFVDVTFEGSPAATLRLVGARSEHRVAESVGDAELSQLLWFGLLSAPLIDADWMKLSIGGGFGLGAAEIDFTGALAPQDRSGMAAAFAGMVEAEFGRHALLGVMGWDALIGEPGDTRAVFSSVMVYGGWRF